MPLLKELENKHKDKMCFILGAGPSLNDEDTDRLKDYVSITANSSIVAMPDCDYYLADDIGVKNWSYYLEELKESKCIKLLFRDKLQDHCGHLPRTEIVWFQHKWWHSPKDNTYNPMGLYMTSSTSEPIIGARTGVGSAMHFAYIMGCDPIVLLGCDCCYYFDKKRFYRYFWQFWDKDEQPYRITGEPVFCYPNKGMKKGNYIDSHCHDFLAYWEKLATQTKAQGINIINASGGILDSYPRMKTDEVLEQYGERKK